MHNENHSLEKSRINRDGLSAGTLAPGFRLPQLNGDELALAEYRGKRVLLVFTDPGCRPCNQLAPNLEHIHRDRADLQILMVSRGDPEINRKKVAEHGLTFPVVLQRQWEISRDYGMFATPIAYLIDEQGVIVTDVAVGGDAILALLTKRGDPMREQMQIRLDELKEEFVKGQGELQKVEQQRVYLRETVLRISGAIQVLEELMADPLPVTPKPVNANESHPVIAQMNGVP